MPAVKFDSTRFGPAYEFHGVKARDYWAARDAARAKLDALKVKLRGGGC